MSLQAILILALAALVHSTWNLLSKQSHDKQVFLWLALVAALVVFLVPFAYLYTPIALVGLGIAVVSGLLEAAYYLLLGSAYQRGDLSLVYPLARGSAPLFVTLFAFLFLREVASPGGIAGIVLIVCGIYSLHLTSFDRRGIAAPLRALRHDRASQLALVLGVVIASYSIVDKVGVQHVNPLLYIYVVFLVSAVALAPYMLLARSSALRSEWRANKLRIVSAGVMFIVSYLLVLVTLTISKVSYTASIREMSVVFGALMGTLILHEPFGANKLAGALLIFAGIVAIAVAA